MSKVSVALNSIEVATGKKLQKTLTDIRDSASSAQIKTFTQALNGLTTNIYGETNRISKLNVDTEEIPSGGGSSTTTKLVPEFSLDPFVRDGTLYSAVIHYTGNGTLKVAYLTGTTPPDTIETIPDTGVTLLFVDSLGQKGVVYAEETEQYYSLVYEFTAAAE